ncbi:MAG: response regulator [Anaerolineae bacterium]|nr:response regulator [Anaerolineae bacterium]
MPAREDFINWLRDALGHLYDTQYLRQSPLLGLLGDPRAHEPAGALRSRLTEAVASLKPASHVPANSRDRRLYDALFYAYVQQLDQRIVADQLALSVRQLRREQRAALEILADRLWVPAGHDGDVPAAARDTAGPVSQENGLALTAELAWLKDLPPEQPTDLSVVLKETLYLIQPLAEQNHTRIAVIEGEGMPCLSAHPVALNQILLNLLNIAITRAAGSRVMISTRLLAWNIEILIRQESVGCGEPLRAADEVASLAIAEHLIRLCDGSFTRSDNALFTVSVVLPALNQLVVLAIDDNADTLQLLERYMVGTRYHLVGTPAPEQAFPLVEAHHPQLILLDVMMPQIDGLKMMGMLRQHPLTQHIPIVVCTILPQEKLVLSLGASGFLRKPFTRQALLDMLDQQLTLPENCISFPEGESLEL